MADTVYRQPLSETSGEVPYSSPYCSTVLQLTESTPPTTPTTSSTNTVQFQIFKCHQLANNVQFQIFKCHQLANKGEKLSFSSGGFPHLKILRLRFLRDLEDWEIGEGALPKLEKLELQGCHKLKMIPQRLPNSVYVTCKNPCISGVEKYNICPHSAKAAQLKNPSPSSTST